MEDFYNIFSGFERGYIAVNMRTALGKGLVADHFFTVKELAAASQRMQELSKTTDAYFSFNVLKEPPVSGRGKTRDFFASSGIFLDADTKQGSTSIHAADEKLPGSIEEVFALLEEKGLPRPTQLISSGNGYYFQYLFTEPFYYETEAERAAFIALCKGFHARFSAAFAERGWTLDNVSDLPRVTRMSGTLNHKTDPAKPVTLVGYYPERRMTKDWFEEFAKVAIKGSNAVVIHRGTRAKLDKADKSSKDKAAKFDSVASGCRWARSVLDRIEGLPYPEWMSLAGILKHCEDGEDIFHELSAHDPRYDPDETQRLFDAIQGPMTCDHISTNGGENFCRGCPAYANRHVGSPIAFGGEPPHLAAALGTYVYVVKREMYVNTISGQELTKINFSDMHLKHFNNPNGTALASRLLLQTHKTAYLPGVTDLFVSTADGALLFNVWKPGGLSPEAGEAGIILQHLEYLVPVERERDHLLDVLAHTVQQPGRKLRHAILMIGGQGIGKSWFFELFVRMFGASNVVLVDNETLVSQFNARMGDKQIAVLEEVGQEDRADAYNRMKLWITQDAVTVEEKHQPRYDASTPRLIIGFSNRDLPIKIEADDRRFMFIDSPKQARDPEYYTTLFTDGLSQAGAFLKILLDRDIKSFSPDAHPPKTDIKSRIVGASRPVAEAEIEGMIKDGEAPFDLEYFTLKDLTTELKARVSARANLSTAELSRALRLFGYVPVQAGQVRAKGSVYRLWAHESSKWATASKSEMRAEIESNPMI